MNMDTAPQITITKATSQHAEIIAAIAVQSFIESHGHSAPAADIENYVATKYSIAAIADELSGNNNVYYIIYYDQQPAGYSKILLNTPPVGTVAQNFCKLDRLYLLAQFHDLKLGLTLLNHNISLSKENAQAGIWLYTWTSNHRAVRFYTRAGFKITGHTHFRISETHTNPNHQMLLLF